MAAPPSAHYETVSTAFQVLDIADPLVTTAAPDWTVADVTMAITQGSIEHPENFFAIVRDGKVIHGYFALDSDADSQANAAQACIPILADQIVPGSLPLLELIPLFEQHYFFFVLTRNDLTHVVSFLDLSKLPIQLCLFALLTGLEAELIRLLLQWPHAIDVFLSRLPENRQRSAREWAHTRYGEKQVTPERILRATSFMDKITMFLHESSFVAALPFDTQDQAQEFFKELHEIRNRIAHSQPILEHLHTPVMFNSFLSRLRHVTDAISRLASQPLDDGFGKPSPTTS